MSAPQPTCRTCGYVLRWFADQQSWGCDQCRVMTPANQLAASSSSSSSVSVSSEMAQLTQLAKPRGASGPLANRTPLLIGAGVAGAATLGVVLALVTANSGPTADPTTTAAVESGGSAATPTGSGTGATTRAGSGTAERPIAPAAVTEGPPELASVGDFWLYPRSDGSVRVASPLFEITFPKRPEISVNRMPATAKSKAIDVYRFVASADDKTLRQLELVSTGANSLQNEAMAVDIRQKMAKISKVLETPRSEQGIRVREFEAQSDAERMRVIHTQDVVRGVFLTLTTVAAQGSPAELSDDATRTSFHLRNPKEVVDDPAVLVVKASKRGKAFLVQDAAHSFSIQLPGAVTVARTAEKRVVTVTVGEKKPAAKVTFAFAVMEATSANALMADESDPSVTLSKTFGVPYQRVAIKMGGIAGYAWQPKGKLPRKTKRVEMWVIRDRVAHRLYSLTCFGRPCAPLAKTLQLPPATPTK